MTTSDELQFSYEALRTVLEELSPGDEAALRSLKRKYDQLQDALWFGDITCEAAKEELLQECYDCMPVDE